MMLLQIFEVGTRVRNRTSFSQRPLPIRICHKEAQKFSGCGENLPRAYRRTHA
jgi:hypothetical protein